VAFIEPDDVLVALKDRSSYRQVAVNFGMVHICALRQQELGQLKVISLARHHQRGNAGLVLRIIEHCSFIKQELGDRDAPEFRAMTLAPLSRSASTMTVWLASAAAMSGVA
jgi:hypothetical protein